MTRAAVRTEQRWTMHQHFEPHRVAKALVVDAYEAALPTRRRRSAAEPVLRTREQEVQQVVAGRRARWT